LTNKTDLYHGLLEDIALISQIVD